MAEPTPPENQSMPQLQTQLHDVAKRLRESAHLGVEEREELAKLMDELGQALDLCRGSPETASHLAASAANIARGLHDKHDVSLLKAARKRLEQVFIRAETEAPRATGIAERLL